MSFEVLYHKKVIEDDISRLSTSTKKQIKTAIERKLMQDPERFGAPLRRGLFGYRKLRVGDYRVVFRIQDKKVKIFAIIKRSEVYSKVIKRIKGI